MTLICQVKSFVTIEPINQIVVLKGKPNTPISKEVTIVPEDDFRFKITEILPKDGTNIDFDLREGDVSGKQGFILTIRNKKTEIGSYEDTIILRTDSRIRPEFLIGVRGKIRDQSGKGPAPSKPESQTGVTGKTKDRKSGKSPDPFSDWQKRGSTKNAKNQEVKTDK